MANVIKLSKGLDVNLKGKASLETMQTKVEGQFALVPDDFYGMNPKVVVKEGDIVKVGDALFVDKNHPEVKFVSPVSGTVSQVERGERRKVMSVRVDADGKQDAVSFTEKEPLKLLLESGLFGFFRQRPYDVVANPEDKPKAIFISAFNSMPLAADFEYVLQGQEKEFQAGLSLLAKIAKVHLGISAKQKAQALTAAKDCTVTVFDGPAPAGNVGVQISHIAPIQKGETVWTISPLLLAAFGRVINTGKLDLTRKVAVTGPMAPTPAYVEALPGTPVKELAAIPEGVRVIGGDVLSGENLGKQGYLGFFQDQITLLNEGYDREWFGWAKPFRPKVHSSSWCYFSWLTPKKQYDMDTNLHGGPRAFVETKCFEDVTPMDIFPLYLIKACLAGDIEKMEKFGIYEVLPEDLALCDYVDPSKNDIQAIIQQGIDLMIKEMA